MAHPTPQQVDERIKAKTEFELAKARLNEIDHQIMEFGVGTYYGSVGAIEVYRAGPAVRIRFAGEGL